MTKKYKASPEQIKKAKEKLDKTLQESEHDWLGANVGDVASVRYLAG